MRSWIHKLARAFKAGTPAGKSIIRLLIVLLVPGGIILEVCTMVWRFHRNKTAGTASIKVSS